MTPAEVMAAIIALSPGQLPPPRRPTETDWRAEHRHFAHLEPDFYKWKAWMLAERAGRHLGDEEPDSPIDFELVVFLIYLVISAATITACFFL